MHSLLPRTCLRGTSLWSESVTTKDLGLMTRPVMNRRLKVVEQATATINAFRWRLSVKEETLAYIYALCHESVVVLELTAISLLFSLELERFLVSPLDRDGSCETGLLCSGAHWRCQVLGRRKQWQETGNFRNPVRQLWGGVQVAFGLAGLIVWMWGCRLLDEMFLRNSSRTSGAKLFRWRRISDGFRSPFSLCVRSWRTRSLRVMKGGVLARSSCWCKSRPSEVMMSSTSVACRYSSWDMTYFVLSLVTDARANWASACASLRPSLSVQKDPRRGTDRWMCPSQLFWDLHVYVGSHQCCVR